MTRGMALALAVVLAGCGGASTVGQTDTALGSLASSSSTESSTTVAGSPPVVATDQPIAACTWRWFDRWDITVVVPEGVAPGTKVDAQVSLFQGDVSSVGATGSFVTGDPGPQVVSLTVAPMPWIDANQLDVYRHDALSPGAGSECDVQLTGLGDDRGGFAELTYDVLPPADDGTPLGSLLASVDSPDAPMFPLAELMWMMHDEPAFDTLHVVPEGPLAAISVHRDGACRTITSQYPSGSFNVTVQQTHGCDAPLTSTEMPEFVTETVPDPHWAVTVTGPKAGTASTLAALHAIEVPGGEPADGPPTPTADEWIVGYLAAHTDVTELARFPWRTGTIVVVRRDTEVPLDAYLEPLRFGVNANYGTTGSMCEEYTVGISSSAMGAGAGTEPGGFAWFVARDPGTVFSFTVPGLPTAVPLQQVPSGEYVGFVDLGAVAVQPVDFTVHDAAGNTVPCTQ